MRRYRASVLVCAALAWALALLTVKATGGGDEARAASILLDGCTGGTLLAAGAWAVRRQADQRIGWLLVLASVAWFAEDFGTAAQPALLLLGKFTAFASVPALALLALTFPTGRLRGRIDRVILAVLALLMLLVLPLHDVVYGPPTGCCPSLGFTIGASHGPSGVERAWQLLAYVGAGAVALGIGARLVARWRSSTAPTRRLIRPFVASAGLLVALNVLDVGWRTLGPQPVSNAPFTEAHAVTTLLVALSLPIGLLLRRLARASVIDAVLQIGDRDPQTVVAEALQDPMARLTPGGDEPDAPRPGRALLKLRSGERPVATLEYDEAWAEDPGVLDALGRALTLGLENRRLQESRALLVRSADEQRRRLESDLHDGAQQRLIAVGLLLGRLRDEAADNPALEARVGQAADLLADAMDELRTLARGARPSPLLIHGVVGAVRQLVQDAPLPVDVEGAVSRSLPEHEAAAYFVVCEALANAGRHGAATRCRVTLRLLGGRLRIEVADNGRGGARMRPGGGLEGLAHRVEALGGDLSARDGEGGGSVVRAALPWPTPEHGT